MTSHELIRLLVGVDAALFAAFLALLKWRRRERPGADARAKKPPALKPPFPREPFPAAPGPACSDDEEIDWEDAVGVVLGRYTADADRLTQAMTPGEIDVTIRALTAAKSKRG